MGPFPCFFLATPAAWQAQDMAGLALSSFAGKWGGDMGARSGGHVGPFAYVPEGYFFPVSARSRVGPQVGWGVDTLFWWAAVGRPRAYSLMAGDYTTMAAGHRLGRLAGASTAGFSHAWFWAGARSSIAGRG